ncbi:hypothetical protein EI94DRAFT_1523590, partial [Lactarius quietus]
MKENRLAVLALQETHLDETLIHSINKCFGKRILVINSQLPTNPHLSAGVAFVINKALIVTRDMEKVELIEGRAMAIKFKWHEDNDIILINIYTLNDKVDHRDFWEQVDTRRRAKGLRRPDMMLQDFNITKDVIDRAPAHLDDVNAIAALRNLRQCLRVKDIWRHTFPDERAFSFRASCRGHQIMSRLDRIYMSDTTGEVSSDWKMKQTPVPTDHWMVSTNYMLNQAPFIGKGRWTMQVSELKKNEPLLEKIINWGKQLKKELHMIIMTLMTHEVENPQTLWTAFKKDIVKIAKKHCTETRGKLMKKMEKLEKEIKEI